MVNNDYDNDVRNRGKAGSPFVHIPGEVAFNPDLTKSDMFVFWIISMFDTNKTRHFFASNAYVAKKLNISEAQVTRSITRLKEEGYIKQISFDGRKRTLAIDKNYVLKHENHIHNFNNDESFSKVDNDEEDEQDPAKKITLPNESTQVSQKAYADPAKKLMQTQPKSLVYNNKNIIKDYNTFSKEKDNVSEETLIPNKSLLKENEDKSNSNEDEFIICKQVKDLISYWNSKGKPLTVHQNNIQSKTYKEIKINLVEALDKYSTIKIKQSIDRYYNLISSPFTSLNSSWKNYPKSLNLFLKFNSYVWSEIIKRTPDFNIRSWFKECLKPEKELLEKYTVLKEDKHPEMTEAIKDKFIDEFRYKKEFTVKDEASFRKATTKIFSFIEENDDKIPDKFIRQPVKVIKYLFETVKDCNSKKQDKIYPWYLSQDWLYDQALLTYMEKINVVWSR